MTREHEGGYAALVDTCRLLRARSQNAKLRSIACVLDTVAVLQRLRRTRAARHKEPYEPEDLTELLADARKAFVEHLPEGPGNLEDLRDLLDRVRAHNEAIAALCARLRDQTRK